MYKVGLNSISFNYLNCLSECMLFITCQGLGFIKCLKKKTQFNIQNIWIRTLTFQCSMEFIQIFLTPVFKRYVCILKFRQQVWLVKDFFFHSSEVFNATATLSHWKSRDPRGTSDHRLRPSAAALALSASNFRKVANAPAHKRHTTNTTCTLIIAASCR